MSPGIFGWKRNVVTRTADMLRQKEDDAVSEPTTPRGPRPPEDVFAERVAPLIGLVERWRARIGTQAERWPAVPLPGLEPDDPRRLAAEIAEELLRARGHLVAAEERVRSAAALGRRMRGGAGRRTRPVVRLATTVGGRPVTA